MDLEHLNKKQVILLTLLVSFVTSMATGIVTVSLMEQAPPQVAATVNHIIERTVQQMVPVAGPATVSTTVKTVVVKNDDLAAQSITNARKSIVRIVNRADPSALIARGIIIDNKGTVITDRESINAELPYEAIMADGTRISLDVRNATTSGSVISLILKIGTSTPALTPAVLADTSKFALGQTVLRIGGDGEDMVGEGIISALPSSGTWVQASVSSTVPGSVLVNLFGEVIGITTADSLAKSSSAYSLPSIFKAQSANAGASNVAAVGAAISSSTPLH